MMLIYAIGLWVSRFAMAMISVCAPTIFLLSFVWLPESSVFLTRKNKLGTAEKTLQWALGKKDVDEELEEVKRIVETEDKCSAMTLTDMFKEIFRKAYNRRAFRIGMILLSGLTMTGAAPILAYQSYIYDKAGFEISTNASIIMTGVAIVLAGCTCVTIVRFTGKRMLVLIAAPICVVSLAALAIFFQLQSAGYDVTQFKWVPTVFVMIFVLGFGFGLNPIPLAYMGEIFSVEVKVPAAVLNAFYYAISTTAVVKFYQVRRRRLCVSEEGREGGKGGSILFSRVSGLSREESNDRLRGLTKKDSLFRNSVIYREKSAISPRLIVPTAREIP